jgi:hypothetical protein
MPQGTPSVPSTIPSTEDEKSTSFPAWQKLVAKIATGRSLSASWRQWLEERQEELKSIEDALAKIPAALSVKRHKTWILSFREAAASAFFESDAAKARGVFLLGCATGAAVSDVPSGDPRRNETPRQRHPQTAPHK